LQLHADQRGATGTFLPGRLRRVPAVARNLRRGAAQTAGVNFRSESWGPSTVDPVHQRKVLSEVDPLHRRGPLPSQSTAPTPRHTDINTRGNDPRVKYAGYRKGDVTHDRAQIF